MDLSIFLILLLVTLQFVAEYYNWDQYRVKLGIFIATLIITLPNIIFMVIDWWQSPHSKIALLVLNTFTPILRGETYRLFRWLKSVGMGLTSDELNYLPISNPNNTTDFFMTRECFQASRYPRILGLKVIPEDDDFQFGWPLISYSKCTAFVMYYENETVFVHQFHFSRKLKDLWDKLSYEDFMSHRLLKSSFIRSRTYNNVDVPTINRLISRVIKICYTDMPILKKYECRREWLYFHAASTLDYLNEDLVLIQAQGEAIAVG